MADQKLESAKPIPNSTPNHARTGKAKLGETPLTRIIIAAMQPGQELADPQTPGLRVRCGAARPGGTSPKIFFYRYRDKARALRQIKLGEFGAMTLSGAREALNEERAKLTRGGDPQALKRQGRDQAIAARKAARDAAAKQQNSCGSIVERYLVEIERNRKVKGARETRRMLERAITSVRDLPADTLTRTQAADIIAVIGKSAPRVAAMTRQELRACWEYALSSGRITLGNPFSGRDIGGKFKVKRRRVTLDPEEVATLLRWIREPFTYSRAVADALELTLRTGLRSGEVCGIHTRELELEGDTWWLHIPAERMKAGECPHSVPIVGRALEIIRYRYPKDEGFLFPSRNGGAIDQKVLGVEVYACSGRSKSDTYKTRKHCPIVEPKKWPGLPWAPHDLRRTARTFLANLNCPFEVGEAILAHKLPGVSATYNQSAYREQKLEWLTKLNDYLDRLSGTVKFTVLQGQ
ncbi:MAG TPA: site-specific integrase [Burkholderiales bacterium]|nr:site-specific integrase [Burkholderiales bacterium]